MLEKNKTISVLNKGFVRVVDVMGDDSSVVQAARVSYGAGTKTVREDKGLIRYLMKNKHTSPFEMCEIKFHMKMPIFVARQWVRHRTANINEYSGRYSIMKDEYYEPILENIQPQAKDNKQGRSGNLSDETKSWFLNKGNSELKQDTIFYKTALDKNIAKELARIHLPLSTYTEWYWKCDLHNLLHLLELRTDKHAQLEIRAYADAIETLVREWVPVTYEAWVEFIKNSETFTEKELLVLSNSLLNRHSNIKFQQTDINFLGEKAMTELYKKLGI